MNSPGGSFEKMLKEIFRTNEEKSKVTDLNKFIDER